MDLTAAIGLGVATLGGAAIGFERQWSGHASGPQARFGGIRTFTMLGGSAGLAGWLSVNGLLPLAVVLLAAAAALVVAAYAAASRIDVDGTTEVAAIAVLAAGTLAGSGQVAGTQVFTCGPDDDVHAALTTMKQHRVRRLPVEGFGRTVVGIVSMNDILLAAGPRREVRNDEVVDTFQAICAHHHPTPHVTAA